jgi:hypothetical protein
LNGKTLQAAMVTMANENRLSLTMDFGITFKLGHVSL